MMLMMLESNQRVSSSRSPITPGSFHRLYPCLKCAGEVFRFPDLVCWDVGSISGKCGDYTRKRGYCYPVSGSLGLC